MTTLVATVIVLGVLIFVHESGHFLMARLFGVGVERFSLGFGPRIFGFQRGRTDYRVSAIPLGGYVKMVGEDPEEEIPEADIPESFTHQPVFTRILIVATGPFINLLLGILIYYVLLQAYGTYWIKPVVGDLSPDMPAKAAGVMPGDHIVSINETPIEKWQDLTAMIENSGGKDLVLEISRGRDSLTITVMPALVDDKTIFGEPRKRYMLGIAPAGEIVREKIGPVTAFVKSLESTWEIVRLTAIGLTKMITGTVSTKELGGPILIAQMAGKQMQEGISSFLAYMAFISINLAILNFLPIPVLDGGHLLFYIIEIIRRKPVELKTRMIAQQFGVIFLISLMILVIYNDITRLIQ